METKKALQSKSTKHKKALKITAGVFGGIILLCGIIFALNFNTVMLMMGSGSVKVASVDQLKKKLSSDKTYQNVKTDKNANGKQTLSAQSKDGAVTIEAVESNNGKVKISGNIDVTKVEALKKSNINVNDLQSMKNIADQYVNNLVDQQSVTGVEAYVAKEVLAQYQGNKQNFAVSKKFDQGAVLNVSGDFTSGQVNFDITQ